MPPLDAPVPMSTSLSRSVIEPRRRAYRVAMVSLTPLAWPQLVAWAGDDVPVSVDRSQIPRGVVATARAVMLSPPEAEGRGTVLLRLGDHLDLRMRLFGIEVPAPPRRHPQGRLTEPNQTSCDEAVAYLVRLVGNRHVHVEIYGVDSHRRLLGVFFLDGWNLNGALVEVGLAMVDRRLGLWNPYREAYETAEAAARAAQRGMWAVGRVG